MTSCALFRTSEKIDELEQLSGLLCLTGQGRGRVTTEQNRTLFQYEALFEQEKKRWLLAMNFPVHGEERLDFYWREKPQNQQLEGRFRGRIVQTWESQLSDRDEQALFRQSWPEFQRLMAVFFSVVENPQKYCQKKNQQWLCSDPKMSSAPHWIFTLGKKLEATAILNDQVKLEVESYSTQDKKHDRLKIQLMPRVSGPQVRSLLALELFAQTCELEASSL